MAEITVIMLFFKSTMNKNKYTREGVLLNIVLILFFLLPQNMFLYLTVPVGMLLVSNIGNRNERTWSLYGYIILAVLMTSAVVNLSETWVDSKSYLRALQLIVCFICFGKTKSSDIYKESLIFIIFYLAIFQFAGILHINPIINLSYVIYPLTDKTELVFERSLNMGILEAGGANERLFGIYHNANNCAIYSQILLILLVIEKEQFHGRFLGKWSYYALLLIVILMLIAAGSRTSFIVLVAVGLTMFGSEKKGRLVEIGFIILLFVVLVNGLGIDLRMFKVGDGLNSSFGVKLRIIEDYMESNPSLLKLLFGCFTCQALIPLINTQFAGTDMDFGDMFVQYGIVFLIVISFFLFSVFRSLKKQYRPILWILLWMFSNTIICNFRTSSILLLVLSILVLRSRQPMCNNNTEK